MWEAAGKSLLRFHCLQSNSQLRKFVLLLMVRKCNAPSEKIVIPVELSKTITVLYQS
jgi:hypothetical protein